MGGRSRIALQTLGGQGDHGSGSSSKREANGHCCCTNAALQRRGEVLFVFMSLVLFQLSRVFMARPHGFADTALIAYLIVATQANVTFPP